MSEPGRVLLADDEETFLNATCELLRREGFQCDGAPDASSATQMLKDTEYDVIIADIKMPGNSDLEFISELPKIAEGVPAILVTGYPSIKTAIRSIQLPVVGYLVKPVDFDELLKTVRTVIKHFQAFRAVRGIRQDVQKWHGALSEIEETLKMSSPSSALSSPIDAFLQLTFRNIVSTLSDLKRMTETLATDRTSEEAYYILNCPRHQSLKGALAETIEVLEKTKDAFKSKKLGELRKKLELLLESETA